MAKKTEVKEAKPKIELTEYVLKGDFLPKKKGQKIKLSKGGAKLLKSKKLI